MPFDFFNLSNLAFGNKLTVAFTQLERLVREASEHIGILIQDLRAYSKYLNRNYIIPEPVNNTDGCSSQGGPSNYYNGSDHSDRSCRFN